MNSEAAGLVKHKQAELESLGKHGLARQVLKGLRLKTVVKVSLDGFPSHSRFSRQNLPFST